MKDERAVEGNAAVPGPARCTNRKMDHPDRLRATVGRETHPTVALPDGPGGHKKNFVQKLAFTTISLAEAR